MVQNTQTNSLDRALMEENTSLTPTTAKLVTQLFEAEDCLDKLQTIESDGFVVPLPPPPASVITAASNKSSSRKSFSKLDSSSWQGGTTTVVTPTKSETLTLLDDPPMAIQTRSSSRVAGRATAIVQPQRQVMARKQAMVKRTPVKSRPGVKAMTDESTLSPEESDRLRVRRERNKAAAARCRKRRLDQISTLSDEVADHEDKKRMLEHTIAQLKAQKEELEYILSQHQAECKQFNPISLQAAAAAVDVFPVVAVKSEPMPVLVQPVDQMYQVVQKPSLNHRVNGAGVKAKRPLFLNITPAPALETKTTESVAGITIDTPSNVVGGLSFETLMTSTGLTPTTNIVTPISFNVCTTNSNAPSCSSQQRTSELSLTDLNTPCNENMSLVSL